jgi:hypothetical protein
MIIGLWARASWISSSRIAGADRIGGSAFADAIEEKIIENTSNSQINPSQ